MIPSSVIKKSKVERGSSVIESRTDRQESLASLLPFRNLGMFVLSIMPQFK